jgi:hypothetical protein
MAGALPEPKAATGNFIIRRNREQSPWLAIPQRTSARDIEQYPQADRTEMKYLIVYEKSNTGWGAYASDLPWLRCRGQNAGRSKGAHPQGG